MPRFGSVGACNQANVAAWEAAEARLLNTEFRDAERPLAYQSNRPKPPRLGAGSDA